MAFVTDMDKKKLTAKDLLSDIRSGMSDQEIMAGRGLSAQALQAVFRKLMDAGVLTQAELDGRVSAAEAAPPAEWTCPSCGKTHPREPDKCPECGHEPSVAKAREMISSWDPAQGLGPLLKSLKEAGVAEKAGSAGAELAAATVSRGPEERSLAGSRPQRFFSGGYQSKSSGIMGAISGFLQRDDAASGPDAWEGAAASELRTAGKYFMYLGLAMATLGVLGGMYKLITGQAWASLFLLGYSILVIVLGGPVWMICKGLADVAARSEEISQALEENNILLREVLKRTEQKEE